MEHRKYLIIGGGLAADSAVRGIREIDPRGSALVVSDEDDPPYNRPPLSKQLWRGSDVDTIWCHTELANVELRLGARMASINPSAKTATDAGGNVTSYEKLLLATGGRPRRLWDGDPSVIYFRRFSDFRQTRQAASERAEFAVIGGGFIGPEIAAALAMNGCRVSLIFPGDCIGDHLYPRPLAHFLNVYFRKRGVEVRFNERVKAVERVGSKLRLHVNDNDRVVVDAVVAGIGIEPNVDLAKTAGLQVGNGIIVDDMLRTSDPDIFAAGDVANFPCAVLNRRLRFEHEDNAGAMGRTAGRNLAGAAEAYRHLPFFYSDLFDLGYEAVGDIDSSMATVDDWEETFRKGVIYYIKDRRVRGVLLWNTWGLLDAARQLIGSAPTALIGRLRESA